MGEKTDFSPKMAFCLQGFRLCGGDQRAMKTDKVCDRPLETFGSHPCYLIYIGSYSVSVLFVFLNNGFAQAA